MPKFRDVPSLKTLSIKAVGTVVVCMTPTIISRVHLNQDPQKIVANLQKSIDRLNDVLVSYVPYYLYETMAVEVLKAVKALIEKTKKNYYPHISMSYFLTEMNVVVSLTEVVLNSRLRTVDFSQWPKIMRYVLYKNLEKMSGLEVLNLGSCTGGWRTSEHDKNILDGIKVMKHLHTICLCFDCSDLVIQTISENCPNIQCIDVTSSRSVTDRSIPYLLNCKNLKELQLHRTSVSAVGLAKLISGLPKLQDIGRCDEFGEIIIHLSKNQVNCGPFELRKIHTRNLNNECLRTLVSIFPKVKYICLFHDMHIADLSILVSLVHLRELKLLSCGFYEDFLKQLLEIGGYNFTHLHLEHVDEMDFNVLDIIGKSCPKIKSLVFYNCEFRYGNQRAIEPLCAQPFRNLERIFWVVDGTINHLEYILANAVNIKYIHLGSSTGITHLNIVNILRANPMKYLEELRVLYSSDMSMRTVELLLASCTNLKVLSELESWQGISMEELKIFKDHIRKIVEIDLEDRKLVPGKPYYEKTKSALGSIERFTVIVSWKPPEEQVCPSSVAKFFDQINYNVQVCRPSYKSHVVYSVKTPTLDGECIEKNEIIDFVEWLGMVSIDGDFSGDPDNYLNTYNVPEPNIEMGQIRVLTWRGFYRSDQIMTLLNFLREFINVQDKIWLSLYVQGFSDTPVIEKKKEQNYFTSGDNANIFIFKKSKYWFCKHRCSGHRYK